MPYRDCHTCCSRKTGPLSHRPSQALAGKASVALDRGTVERAVLKVETVGGPRPQDVLVLVV